MEVTIPNKIQLTVMMFSYGLPKQVLRHIQTALETIQQKRLLAAYDMACMEVKEAENKLRKAYSSYQGMDENPYEKKH